MALAALVVRIGGDLTGLNKALTQADKDVQRVGKKLASLGEDLTKGLTVPIVAAGAALAAAAVHVGAFADELLDLVDQTGLSSNTLQEFRHVAAIAGVETDTLADAAIKLTTKLSSGGEQTKELTGALSKLGLRATDINGRLISMDKLLPDIIGRLQGMTDVTTRNAIAADIFGKSWAELAPVLGLGAGAMAAAQKEARDLGLVLSAESLEAADAFRKKLGTLKESAHALALSIGVAVLPIMTKLVDILQDNVVPAVRAVVKWFDDLSPTTKIVIGVVAGLAAAFGPLLVAVGTIMKFWPLLSAAFSALTGPIGLTILAIGSLTVAGIELVKNWDAVKLQFVLAWAAMKDAVFTFIRATLDGLKMVFGWIPKVGGFLEDLSQKFDVLAEQSMAKSGAAAAALEIKMENVATAVGHAAGEVTKMGAALDGVVDRLAKLSTLLPKVGLTPGKMTSGDHGDVDPRSLLPLAPGLADASVDFNKPKKGLFKSTDSLGTKVSQTILAGGGGGPLEQMVQAFASFGPIASVLPVISGALKALEPAITALIQPFVEIGRIIGESLAPILEMLAPVIQLVADILSHTLAPVLRGITIAVSYVMEAFGAIVRAIGKLIDSLPFVSAKGIINAGQSMIDAAKAARKNADATDKATDAVNSFASALTNIPRVLNINALRHMVTGQPTGGPGGGGGGGGGGGTGGGTSGKGPVYLMGDTYVTVTVPGAGDPVAVANAVGAAVERTRLRGGTSRLTLAVR